MPKIKFSLDLVFIIDFFIFDDQNVIFEKFRFVPRKH